MDIFGGIFWFFKDAISANIIQRQIIRLLKTDIENIHKKWLWHNGNTISAFAWRK
jgi:hypothetical protein